ncbi:MAG: hypothetical protein V1906_03145 [Candidatus Woesearchaeota archaeon]
MKKPEDVITIDNADIEFKRLSEIVEGQIRNGRSSSEEMKLLNSIKQKLDFIRYDMFYGDGIHKDLIPKSYKVRNLWRVELFNFWRMLYTIKTDDRGTICFIIDILDHKSYDDKFGYRKK